MASTTEPAAGRQPLSARAAALQQDFLERRGYWTPWLEDMLRLSPDYFEAFLRFTATPWATGPLPAKTKELVYVAIDSCITHLYQPGMKKHIGEAMRHGATAAEIMEVLQLAGAVGLLCSATAAPMLLQALAEMDGTPGAASRPLTPQQRQHQERFQRATGHWDEGCEAMLRLDLGWFDAYAAYLGTAWQTRALDPVTRELIGIAIHASTTLLHTPGIALHLRRALACGATPPQIMEVLQLTSVLGIHSCSVGLPLLTEAMAAAGLPPP